MDKLTWYDEEGRLYCRRGYEVALARLAAYEDTGLMPQEIVKMGMAYEDSKRYSGRLELKLKAAAGRLPRWIPVTEQLPKAEDKYGWVDCIVTVLESRYPTSSYDIIDAPESREMILPAKFDCFQKIWHVADCAVNALIPIEDSPLNGWYVSHWMPLPEPPKED